MSNTKCVRGRLQVFPKLEPSEDLVYTLGVLKGDGHVGNYKTAKYAIILRCVSKAFDDSFVGALQRLGLHPYTWLQPESKKRQSQFFTTARSKIFFNWYKELTLKQIEEMLCQDKNYARCFIRGFYESEGSLVLAKYYYVNGERRERKTLPRTISMVNTDKELLLMVKRLLERLGYKIGEFRKGTDGLGSYRKNPFYRLKIWRKKEVARFLKEIKPCIKNGLYA